MLLYPPTLEKVWSKSQFGADRTVPISFHSLGQIFAEAFNYVLVMVIFRRSFLKYVLSCFGVLMFGNVGYV
jgi:hypothetical protein